MTVRRGRPGRGVFAQRRGAVRTGRRAAAGSVGGWLADRTVRRRWRRLSLSEWLIVLVAVVVAGAFLMLLSMQAAWLALLVGLAMALFLYRELGA